MSKPYRNAKLQERLTSLVHSYQLAELRNDAREQRQLLRMIEKTEHRLAFHQSKLDTNQEQLH